MFGQFFERLNNRLRKPEESQKEGSPFSVKPSGKDHSPHHHLNMTAGASHLQTSLSNHRAFQPPITSVSDDISKFIDQRKMRNPSPICPKTLQDEQDTVHSTTPRGTKMTLNTGLGIRSKGIFQGESYKRLPEFGGKQTQKEPVKNHKESILQDSIKEGSFLAQSIPGSKLTTASKLAEKVGGGVSRNKFLGDGMAQKECKTLGDERFDQGDGQNRLHQAWQGWWNEKKNNSNLLLEASKLNKFEMCWQLLDKSKGDLKADVNYKGENGWTPLHFACLNGNIDLVNLLLYNGAHTDAETTLKYTVLHLAAQKGHVEVFKLLINSGANLNATDMFNNTPLHYAAQNGSKSIVEILLSRPSLNLSIKNNDNQLAFELAESWEVKQLFEAFLLEKKLINSKTNKLNGVQAIKPIKKHKMFEIVNKEFNEAKERDVKRNIGPLRPQPRKNEEPEFEDRRVFSHRSNVTGDTKATSSLNTTESDNGNVSAEEEKIGPQTFKVHGLIGKGSFGEVYLVEKKNTGVKYAMKVLHKSMVNKHNLINYAMTERNVLGVTNHSFIVKLNFAFQTPEKLFLILDYCPGGDLSEHLQREKRFSEEKARIYIAEVLLALEDLHKRDIIFRDLKPDNIVLDADGHIKLTDFGLSKEGILDPSNGAHSFCGSVAYLAPEMLRRTGHGKAVDWYLLGVVFYEMLVGIPPYYANNRDQLFYNIDKAPLKVPSHLSAEAKSLLKGLLQRNPARRLGSGRGDAEEIKTHEFFKNIDWKEVEQKKITPPLVEKKMNFIDKVTYDVFEMDPTIPEDAGKIEGWSFVAPQVDHSLDKRLF